MPEQRKHKNVTDLEKEIEEAEGISLRSGSSYAIEERRKEEEKKEKESKLSKRGYVLLYILISVLVFGLGLLTIALMNLAIHGEFTI